MSHNVKCHTCGRGPDVPRRISTNNDLAVGYRAGQADGCERADGLLLELHLALRERDEQTDVSAPLHPTEEFYQARVANHARVKAARESIDAYLREKGLRK